MTVSKEQTLTARNVENLMKTILVPFGGALNIVEVQFTIFNTEYLFFSLKSKCNDQIITLNIGITQDEKLQQYSGAVVVVKWK